MFPSFEELEREQEGESLMCPWTDFVRDDGRRLAPDGPKVYGLPPADPLLPWVLPLVTYNGSERWAAPGKASESASLPSARAERDLALLQPQTYRRLDAGARSPDDWPEENRVAAAEGVEMTTLPEANLNRWDARVRAQEAAARWEAGKEDAG